MARGLLTTWFTWIWCSRDPPPPMKPQPHASAPSQILYRAPRSLWESVRKSARRALSAERALSTLCLERVNQAANEPTNQSLNAVYLSARNVRFPIAACTLWAWDVHMQAAPNTQLGRRGQTASPLCGFPPLHGCILGALVDCNYHPRLILEPSGTDCTVNVVISVTQFTQS